MTRATLLLALGAATGIALAATGLLATHGRGGGALPSGTIARVNGHAIPTDDYARLLAGLAGDRRNPLDAGRKREVLDRLVEEELLLQRALDLDLARADRKARGDLVQALVATVVAEADAHEPTDAEAEAFYRDNQGFFRQPDRVRVRQIFCTARPGEAADAGGARCAEAARRWRDGEDFETLSHTLGDPVAPATPDVLLPAGKLTEYLGPTAAHTALSIAVGTVADPVRVATGFRVLQVVQRESDTLPPFATVREQVRAEMRRRAGDTALRRYLDALRADADVVVGSVDDVTPAPATAAR